MLRIENLRKSSGLGEKVDSKWLYILPFFEKNSDELHSAGRLHSTAVYNDQWKKKPDKNVPLYHCIALPFGCHC
jgi:hypothetical protein